jgi:hypothetical protein
MSRIGNAHRGEQEMYTTREFARISVFSLATLLGLAARPASAQTLSDKELGALVDKESMTKADHLKLADHYSGEAKQLAKDAERHAGLAVHYRRRRNLPPKVATAFQGMPKHCENLSLSLSNAAKAAQELAAAHRGMADETK